VPVLIQAEGEATFTGQGEVSYAASPATSVLRGTYIPIPLYAGDYVLARQDGQWGFRRLSSASLLHPFDVYASLLAADSFVPFNSDAVGIVCMTEDGRCDTYPLYDLQGRRVSGSVKPGIYIQRGRKVVRN
jgi:hypothetical protein